MRPIRAVSHAVDVKLFPGVCATWTAATIVSARPMVRLSAELSVVNRSDQKIVLVGAKLKKPAAKGLVRVNDGAHDMAGSFPIDPSRSARAIVYFFIPASPVLTGTTMVSDLGVVDQFGNTHWVEKVRFKPA
ncbi:MAG TPA: hypothetical protein VFU38_01240 [Candidatus Krumholzibacteria bacterium]|nr:hypothetical protein [Candidatus Krumholzibacteria bacterium]